jgi:hypothetical protein
MNSRAASTVVIEHSSMAAGTLVHLHRNRLLILLLYVKNN